MPAPLARGVIISISLLIAAGIAVYEHPQVKAWIEENRRKLALALHGLGDEVHPGGGSSSRDDVSLREDNSPEAAERRLRAREAILERARQAHASRGTVPVAPRRRGASFDDMVDEDGKLISKRDVGTATGAAAPEDGAQLRQRSRAADPFADHMVVSYNKGLSEAEALEHATRESQAALASEAAAEAAKLRIDTDVAAAVAASLASVAESEDGDSYVASLLDLTPTTSRAPSSFHPVMTPGSTRPSGAATPRSVSDAAVSPVILSPSAVESIHAWAQSTHSSVDDDAFYSPSASEGMSSAPRSEAEVDADVAQHPVPAMVAASQPQVDSMPSTPRSLGTTPPTELHAYEALLPSPDSVTMLPSNDGASDVELLSLPDDHADAVLALDSDAEAEADSRPPPSTPGTWTEVGSVVSDEEH